MKRPLPTDTVTAGLRALALLAAVALAVAGCAGPRPVRPAPVSPPVRSALPEPPAATELKAIRYTIQVGAFSTPERAAAYEDKLMADGIDAYYFIDTDHLSKVRFGRFDSKAAAREFAANLVARGIIDEYYIVRPRPPTPRTAPLSALRESLVDTAQRFIGTPYQWGGTSARDGFDCSGLTMTVYRLNGLDLPRTARAQYRSGTVVSRQKLQAGDLVFFRTSARGRISHVGVYSGDGKFIHSPGTGKTIRSASLSNSYFSRHFAGARRYF